MALKNLVLQFFVLSRDTYAYNVIRLNPIDMKAKRRKDPNETYLQLSVRVTQAECDRIDFAWRSDLKYANRADYIRDKLGLETWK